MIDTCEKCGGCTEVDDYVVYDRRGIDSANWRLCTTCVDELEDDGYPVEETDRVIARVKQMREYERQARLERHTRLVDETARDITFDSE